MSQNQIKSNEETISEEIKEINEKFGVALEVIPVGGKFVIHSLYQKRNKEASQLTYQLESRKDVVNVLRAIYSALYVKDMSEAEL